MKKSVHMRVDEEILRLIDKAAESAGMTRTRYVIESCVVRDSIDSIDELIGILNGFKVEYKNVETEVRNQEIEN